VYSAPFAYDTTAPSVKIDDKAMEIVNIKAIKNFFIINTSNN
jgi:hypothetical protein